MNDNFHRKAFLEIKPTIGENKSVVRNTSEEVVSAGMRISHTRVVQICRCFVVLNETRLVRSFKVVHFLETVKYVKPPV